ISPQKAAARAASMPAPGIGSNAGVGHKRQRSFLTLLRAFVEMMHGHRLMVVAVLSTLAISTILGLITPYGIRIVFDNVLGGQPLANTLPKWLPRSLIDATPAPRQLLAAVAIAMILIPVASSLINIWGRWHATRITKRIQISVRRQVFNHAVRLPLHRVYE